VGSWRRRWIPVSIVLFVASFSSTAFAQRQARIAIAHSTTAVHTRASVPGCPDQSGILDSISVPVNEPLDLQIVISSPAPPGGAAFRLSSDNPAYVAAGDKRQGFLPIVTIPEGETYSNPFTIFGISVGQTLLRSTPLTSGFLEGAFRRAPGRQQVGIAIDRKFLDANDPPRPAAIPGPRR